MPQSKREPMAVSLPAALVKYIRAQAKTKRRAYSYETEELLEMGIRVRDGEEVFAELKEKIES